VYKFGSFPRSLYPYFGTTSHSTSFTLFSALGLVALSTASLLVGYHLGKFYGVTATKGKEKVDDGEARNSVKDVKEDDDDEDEGDIADGDLSAIQPGFLEPCKMVGSSTVLHAC
jgi:PTH2 family peptidyl-tRNA hydrolase